jgi:hypothetical protein
MGIRRERGSHGAWGVMLTGTSADGCLIREALPMLWAPVANFGAITVGQTLFFFF